MNSLTMNAIIKKIPQRCRLTMATAGVVGIIAYAYAFLNPIFFHDGSGLAMPYGWEYVYAGSMRMTWLTSVWNILQAGAQVPWFAGLISLTLYGLSAYFVCEALEIKSEICAVLTTGVMTITPALISSHVYGAGGVPYTISLFFASLAAWSFFSKRKYHYILFCISVMITVATYTNYISWTAVVFLIRQIRDLLKGKKGCKKIWTENGIAVLLTSAVMGINMAVCGILISISKMEFQDRVTSLWQNGSSERLNFARASLHMIIKEFLPPSLVDKLGREPYFYSLFTKNRFMAVLFYVAVIFTFIYLVEYIRKNKNRLQLTIQLFIHLVMLFFSMDILTYVTNSHVLMQFGHIAPWILMLILLEDFADSVLIEKRNGIIQGGKKWEFCVRIKRKLYIGSVIILCIYTIISNCLMANVGYMRGETNFRAGLLLMERIVVRMESIDGYVPGQTGVYFLGHLADYGNAPMDAFDFAEGLTGISVTGAYTHEYSFQTFLDEHTGANVCYAAPPQFYRIEAKDAFDYLNEANEGQFSGFEDEFIEKYNGIENFPSTNNYFWFHGILVFKLRVV